MNTGTMNMLFYTLIIIIPLIAQVRVNGAYSKYKKEKNSNKLSGFEVARKILDSNGLEDVYVVETSGNLTDHYDPSRKVIKLSRDIFHGDTIAAASVAAHECGHAIQDKDNYTFMKIRSFLVPLVNFVSGFSWVVIVIGLFTEIFNIFIFGISLISITLLFQLVTLPVEFDASKRAQNELDKLNLVSNDEMVGVKNMLSAAAMTYVASVLTSVLEILRLLMLFNDRD